MVTLRLESPPASEPVSVTEAEQFLKLEAGTDTDVLTRLIGSARQTVEAVTGRVLITQSWALDLDRWPFPSDGGPPEISLPKPPLQSVTAVFVARDGGDQVLPTDSYAVQAGDTLSRLIILDPAVPRPKRGGAITVQFDAGYGTGAAAVPSVLRQAVLHQVAALYAHRGDTDRGPSDLVHALIAPFRVVQL